MLLNSRFTKNWDQLQMEVLKLNSHKIIKAYTFCKKNQLDYFQPKKIVCVSISKAILM